MINHPHGNFKSQFIKGVANFLQIVSLGILSFFLKIDKKKHQIIISRALIAPWKEKKVNEYFNKIKNYTLLDEARLFTLYYHSEQLKNINADILDLGCMRGGAGMLMSLNNRKGRVFLIDTFSGFSEYEGIHKKKIFEFKDINFLKKKISELKLKNTQVFQSKFPYNAKKLNLKKIKLCHIDVNTYKSTKESFDFVKKKIIKNGIIIFDDYGILGVEQIIKFIDEIKLKEKNNFHFFPNLFGQCILVKK